MFNMYIFVVNAILFIEVIYVPYKYMCVRVYLFMHIFTYVCIYVFLCVCVYVSMHIFVS